ncbi:BZ3500_MvSof-1268-A1-R1_Chr2-2g05168 [Microbotryum saponariae]|uniref:BZ3500_MvSof-1268-A1-R1_Chr2-2g05168 protein n=1 Tax=Microbotryum saponariae TaxID=289078 RepID=A0A2X0LWX2_9BASI|nr:BZ3500_MvSof-1268-A1-R1_Chr2-2g05168 [Microbotryum saponariae]SDA00995.1 BZ3501_MvSof-1269-A2-R1_Chr2-2g04842 [Microbotryum saponariae]
MSRFSQPASTTRRREASFPSLGSSQQQPSSTASQTTSARAPGAWGTASSAPLASSAANSTTPNSNSATIAEVTRKSSGPSLSLGTAAQGTHADSNDDTSIHPLKYTWDVWFSHRSGGTTAGKNTRKDGAAASAVTTAAAAAEAAATPVKPGKEKESREEWEGGVVRLGGFSSIESLHPFLAHLTCPSALPASVASTAHLFDATSESSLPPQSNVISDLNIFRSPIAPAWEDTANTGGGRWVLRLRKGVADRVWEEVVYALVGERIGGDDERIDSKVNGVVLSVRKDEDILSLWCAPTSREQRDLIREALRAALEPLLTLTSSTNLQLDYKPHPVAGHATVPTRNGVAAFDGENGTASPNGVSHRHRSDRDHHHHHSRGGDHHERRANAHHSRREDGTTGDRRERTTPGGASSAAPGEGRERRNIGFSSYTNRGLGSAESRGEGGDTPTRSFGSATGGFGSRPRRGSLGKEGPPAPTNSRWT